ncbi:MAG: hypothetical protein ACQEQL_08960 [Pseudomonadota bacterium]
MTGFFKGKSGNALFLILIAVALFAALSYAVTQSGRGGGDISREQEEIAVAQVAQYIGQIEQALLRLQVINGCSDTDISFDHASWGHGNYTHTSPAAEECQIFHANGGGASYQTISENILNTTQSGNTGYGQYAFSGGLWIFQSGDAGVDLTMIAGNLTESACLKIQRSLNQSGSFQTNGSSFLGSLQATNMAFDGDYANQYSFSSSRQYSCLQLGGSTDAYLFYYTLIDR